MSKASEENKQRYSQLAVKYQQTAVEWAKRERDLTAKAQKPENENSSGPLYLQAAKAALSASSYYAGINGLALRYLAGKNEEALGEARKTLFQCVLNLELVYTRYIDASFSEYEPKLRQVLPIDEFARYGLIRNALFYCDYLEQLFGENNKWKWSFFLDTRARAATALKNSFNLKTLLPLLDPRAPRFAERVYYVTLSRDLLQRIAADYRTKYELVSNLPDDFKKAIDYLTALKRFLIFLNRHRESEEVGKQIDIWKMKLDNDMKKAELQKKQPPK